jgi:hypothetical protein
VIQRQPAAPSAPSAPSASVNEYGCRASISTEHDGSSRAGRGRLLDDDDDEDADDAYEDDADADEDEGDRDEVEAVYSLAMHQLWKQKVFSSFVVVVHLFRLICSHGDSISSLFPPFPLASVASAGIVLVPVAAVVELVAVAVRPAARAPGCPVHPSPPTLPRTLLPGRALPAARLPPTYPAQ